VDTLGKSFLFNNLPSGVQDLLTFARVVAAVKMSAFRACLWSRRFA
jgi:hypothetical protein